MLEQIGVDSDIIGLFHRGMFHTVKKTFYLKDSKLEVKGILILWKSVFSRFTNSRARFSPDNRQGIFAEERFPEQI